MTVKGPLTSQTKCYKMKSRGKRFHVLLSDKEKYNMSIFEKPEKMPTQIASLHKLTTNAKKIPSQFLISEFDIAVEEALKYLNDRYKILFKRRYNYTNEHIAETVFECL